MKILIGIVFVFAASYFFLNQGNSHKVVKPILKKRPYKRDIQKKKKTIIKKNTEVLKKSPNDRSGESKIIEGREEIKNITKQDKKLIEEVKVLEEQSLKEAKSVKNPYKSFPTKFEKGQPEVNPYDISLPSN